MGKPDLFFAFIEGVSDFLRISPRNRPSLEGTCDFWPNAASIPLTFLRRHNRRGPSFFSSPSMRFSNHSDDQLLRRLQERSLLPPPPCVLRPLGEERIAARFSSFCVEHSQRSQFFFFFSQVRSLSCSFFLLGSGLHLFPSAFEGIFLSLLQWIDLSPPRNFPPSLQIVGRRICSPLFFSRLGELVDFSFLFLQKRFPGRLTPLSLIFERRPHQKCDLFFFFFS